MNIQNVVVPLLLSLAIAGCRTSSEERTGSAGADRRQQLIIYTGRDKNEVAAVVDLFEQKFPQYKGNVDTVILGAQAALDRLRAEKANPQAGFLWGGTLQG